MSENRSTGMRWTGNGEREWSLKEKHDLPAATHIPVSPAPPAAGRRHATTFHLKTSFFSPAPPAAGLRLATACVSRRPPS